MLCVVCACANQLFAAVRFLIPEVQPTLPTVEVCVGLADESTHSLQLSKVLQK